MTNINVNDIVPFPVPHHRSVPPNGISPAFSQADAAQLCWAGAPIWEALGREIPLLI